jgi:uncharacterized RDD family membrane protein YckC
VSILALRILAVIEDHWSSPSTASAISIFTSCWLLADDLVAIVHSKRRALHDIIGGTVVVKEEPNKQPEPTSGLRSATAHQRMFGKKDDAMSTTSSFIR